jgi:hypothetical protein
MVVKDLSPPRRRVSWSGVLISMVCMIAAISIWVWSVHSMVSKVFKP